MSDKEESTASLGLAEILSVKHSVCPSIPALPNGFEESSEIGAAKVVPAGKKAANVLEDEPAGAELANQSEGDKGHVAARIVHSETLSGDAEALAGASENKAFNRLDCSGVDAIDVSKVRFVRPVSEADLIGVLVDFGAPAPIKVRHRNARSVDAGEHGCSAHARISSLRQRRVRKTPPVVNVKFRACMGCNLPLYDVQKQTRNAMKLAIAAAYGAEVVAPNGQKLPPASILGRREARGADK